MHEHDGYITDAAPPPTRRRFSVAWLGLILVAWVLYELTRSPALAVIALCSKFGWEDFRTARWLRRRDPRRGRAWASWFLYMACGLWKMAITATLMIFAYILFLVLHRQLGGQGLDMRAMGRQMAGAVLVTLGGIVFSTLAVWLAIGVSLLAGCKLWLHSSVHANRRQDHWPPPDPPARRANLLDILVWTTLFAVGGPALLIGMALAVAQVAGVNRPGGMALFVSCLGGALVLAGLGARWLVRGVVDRRVLARCPSDCWGSDRITSDDPFSRDPTGERGQHPARDTADDRRRFRADGTSERETAKR